MGYCDLGEKLNMQGFAFLWCGAFVVFSPPSIGIDPCLIILIVLCEIKFPSPNKRV